MAGAAASRESVTIALPPQTSALAPGEGKQRLEQPFLRPQAAATRSPISRRGGVSALGSASATSASVRWRVIEPRNP
jgi:hypothetical protein